MRKLLGCEVYTVHHAEVFYCRAVPFCILGSETTALPPGRQLSLDHIDFPE